MPSNSENPATPQSTVSRPPGPSCDDGPEDRNLPHTPCACLSSPRLADSQEIPLLGGLRVIDKEMPQNMVEKFQDLAILYRKALWEAVSKPKRRGLSLSKRTHVVGDISMKLKCLGECDCTARPYIVLQCENKTTAGRVLAFFSQKHVLDKIQPHFEVKVVESDMMRLMEGPSYQAAHDSDLKLPTVFAVGSIKVLILSSPRTTLCGAPMLAELPDDGNTTGQSVRSTIAGTIIAEHESGAKIYGLTAGHAIAALNRQTWSEFSSESDETDHEDVREGEEDEEEDEKTEEGKPDAYSKRHGRSSQPPIRGVQVDLADQSDQMAINDELGRILTFSTLAKNRGHDFLEEAEGSSRESSHGSTDPIREGLAGANFDWALISLVESFHARPNYVELGTERKELFSSVGPSTSPFTDRGVIAITSRGSKHGKLSEGLSFLMMAPGKALVKTLEFSPVPGAGKSPSLAGHPFINSW